MKNVKVVIFKDNDIVNVMSESNNEIVKKLSYAMLYKPYNAKAKLINGDWLGSNCTISIKYDNGYKYIYEGINLSVGGNE